MRACVRSCVRMLYFWQAQDEHEKQQWTSTLRRTIVASDSRLSDKVREADGVNCPDEFSQ